MKKIYRNKQSWMKVKRSKICKFKRKKDILKEIKEHLTEA